MAKSGGDNIFAAILSEPTETIIEEQPLARQRNHLPGIRTTDRRRSSERDGQFHRDTTGDLVRQTAVAINNDRACDCLQQYPILWSNLLAAVDEDASRAIEHVCLDTTRDQSHYLFLQ